MCPLEPGHTLPGPSGTLATIKNSNRLRVLIGRLWALNGLALGLSVIPPWTFQKLPLGISMGPRLGSQWALNWPLTPPPLISHWVSVGSQRTFPRALIGAPLMLSLICPFAHHRLSPRVPVGSPWARIMGIGEAGR